MSIDLPEPRKSIAAYLLLQSILVAAWWAMLLCFPETIHWFQPANWPDSVLMSFGIPDLVFAIVGSLVAAYASWFSKRWAGIVVWVLAGGLGYATLFCLAASIGSDEAWVATSMMVIISGLTLVAATMFGCEAEPEYFRSMHNNRSVAFSWTLFQIVIFWSTFLWIFPKGICELSTQLGMPNPAIEMPSLGWSIFAMASILGFSSAWVMSEGGGTPLPTATTSELMVKGPYRYVRNPMAVAGISQGIGVGLVLGNAWVLGYAFLGAFVWHFLARPPEEEFLLAKFGDSYRDYKNRVGLWLPVVFRKS